MLRKFFLILPLSLLILPFFFLILPSHVRADSLKWQLVYPSVKETTSIKISELDDQLVYASIRLQNNFDLLKSENGGITWTSIKGPLIGSDANWISTFPGNKNVLAISLWGSGVYLSENTGKSWIRIYTSSVPRSVAIDPKNLNVIFVGIGGNHDGNSGVYKTTNKGLTWKKTTLANNNAQIIIDDSDSNRIFADADPYFFRSMDGGNSWVQLPVYYTFSNSIIDKRNTNIIYTSQFDVGYGIYKSLDNGNSWLSKSNSIKSPAFRLAQDADGSLYASRFFSGGGVWRSKDGAETWENVADPAWGTRNTWGLDARNGRVFVSVEGLGIYFADTNPTPNPVVLIPGFLGSYSYKGLVLNQPTTYSDWILTPVFSDDYYQPLLATLKNAKLTENNNLFTFAYDWRKPVAENAAALNAYLNSEVIPKNPGRKANLAAHSMGGLVARYCFEKVSGCADKIHKIVTGGTPHFGSLKAYSLWEAGEFQETNPVLKILENIVLRAQAPYYLTNKDIIQNKIPSVRDFLPIFNYIKDRPYFLLSDIVKNPTLESLAAPSSLFLNNLLAYSGNNLATDSEFSVQNPTPMEKILGLWPDGKVVGSTTNIGDGTVLKSSSEILGAGNKYYSLEHKDYFRDPVAQSDLLTTFNLVGTPATSSPNTSSILAFLIHSPASISVSDWNGQPVGVNLEGKLAIIKNPKEGTYNVTLTGTDNGGGYNLESYAADAQNPVSTTNVLGTINAGETQSYSFSYQGASDSDFIGTTANPSCANLNLYLSQIDDPAVRKSLKMDDPSDIKFLQKNLLETSRLLAQASAPEKRQLYFSYLSSLIRCAANQDKSSVKEGPIPGFRKVLEVIQKQWQKKSNNKDISYLKALNLQLAQEFLNQADNALMNRHAHPALFYIKAAHVLITHPSPPESDIIGMNF